MRLRDVPENFREIQVGEIFLQMYLISVSTCPDFGGAKLLFSDLEAKQRTRDPFLTHFSCNIKNIYTYMYIDI